MGRSYIQLLYHNKDPLEKQKQSIRKITNFLNQRGLIFYFKQILQNKDPLKTQSPSICEIIKFLEQM